MLKPRATCPDGTGGTDSSGDVTRSHYSWPGGTVGVLSVTLPTPPSPLPALMPRLGDRGVSVDELGRVLYSGYDGFRSRLCFSVVKDIETVAAPPDLKMHADGPDGEVQDVMGLHSGVKSDVLCHHSTSRFSTPTALFTALPISTAYRNWLTAYGTGSGRGARGAYWDGGCSGLVTTDATDVADYLGLDEDGETCNYGGGDDDPGEPDGGGYMVLKLLGPGLRSYGAARVPHEGASTEETTRADDRDLAYMARYGGGRVWGT